MKWDEWGDLGQRLCLVVVVAGGWMQEGGQLDITSVLLFKLVLFVHVLFPLSWISSISVLFFKLVLFARVLFPLPFAP